MSEVPGHNRLGAVFVPKPNNEVGLFCRLLPGTPAEEAGLKEGDRLLSVDGKSFNEDEKSVLFQLGSLFSQAAGTDVTIRVMRGESELTVVATLRNMLH